MFAVPGWSVSADKLKTETATNLTSGGGSQSKKRKRGAGPGDVNPANVGDMWDRVIEKKESGKAHGEGKSDRAEKRAAATERKRAKKLKAELDGVEDGAEVDAVEKTAVKPAKAAQNDGDDEAPAPKRKKDKKQKKDRAPKESEAPEADEPAPKPSKKPTKLTASTAPTASPSPSPPPAPAPKAAQPALTPLQASMRAKLISARFRHLNEALYTRPSGAAMSLFAESPDMFAQYHEGFRKQVAVWPENPVDGYIRDLRARGKVKVFGAVNGRGGKWQGDLPPLPRTEGVCTVADLGCGDGMLGATLLGVGVEEEEEGDKSAKDAAKRQKRLDKKLGLAVLSFDLQSPAKHVKLADIANLPLRDGQVDVAIFCLALMGTNWLDFIEEAYRVLRWKGELWVAEIKSRFSNATTRGKHNVVSHSVGRQRKAGAMQAGGKKGKKGGEEENHDADLAVVVDGEDDRRQETDVSAFVEALRKRGFVLEKDGGETYPAVDMGNKMFVKMRFVKAATPVKGQGKEAVVAKGASAKGPKRKFGDFGGDDEEDDVDEAKILKPCVYKIR